MNNKFNELDECLSKQYSIDYWEDNLILYACELIRGFSPTDWDCLEKVWREKSLSWQKYLSQILDSGDVERGIPLLLEILAVDDEEIVISALDSLRNVQENMPQNSLTSATEVRLRQIALQSPSDLSSRVINRFLDKYNGR